MTSFDHVKAVEERERVGLMKELGHIAKRLLLNDFGQINDYELKGEVDVVTRVDKAVENATVSRIRTLFRNDSVIAEEGSEFNGNSGYSWVIDPLDGTTNYAHGYPFFAFSCGLRCGDEAIAGLVEVPFTGETIFALKGKGAFLNGKAIHVSSVDRLKRALLVTGLPYFRAEVVDNLLPPMRRAVLKGQGLRRGGAAAVDMCYLACGRLDGYFEIGLKPWDMAAGELMIREAGGRLSDYSNGPFSIFGRELVASNGRIHNELVEEVVQG